MIFSDDDQDNNNFLRCRVFSTTTVVIPSVDCTEIIFSDMNKTKCGKRQDDTRHLIMVIATVASKQGRSIQYSLFFLIFSQEMR